MNSKTKKAVLEVANEVYAELRVGTMRASITRPWPKPGHGRDVDAPLRGYRVVDAVFHGCNLLRLLTTHTGDMRANPIPPAPTARRSTNQRELPHSPRRRAEEQDLPLAR